MSLTFCIGYRDTSEERRQNLLFVLNWFHSISPKSPCIVVESDTTEKTKTILPDFVDHYFTYSDMPYNRAKVLNYAVSKAETDVVVCQDADCVVTTNTFHTALGKIYGEHYDFCIPYVLVLDLSVILTNIFIKYGIIAVADWALPIRSLEAYGGICVCKRESYLEIGGFNEQFLGWGGEDNEFYYRASKLKRLFKPVGKWDTGLNLYHLYHSRTINDGNKNPHYQKNRAILETIYGMSQEELVAYSKELSRATS